jgi:AraC family transcriptional regulator of adaptative response/methylated-DNA-[protein]-cysteine methyltransferase
MHKEEAVMTGALNNGLVQLSRDYALVEKALVYVDEHAQRQPDLAEIAAAVGMSEFHFQRLFTQWAGISPKRFLEFVTRERARDLLDRSATILQTTHGVGLSSSGRLHDLFINTQAMTPGQYKSRGLGLTIRYGLHPSPFGPCLVGVTDDGICHLGFLRTPEEHALGQLSLQWKHAKLVQDQAGTRDLVGTIFELESQPRRPLHVLLRGTNFQIKVWEALLAIPPASVVSYQVLARMAGNPLGTRAVAHAVARNPVPVLIPCHRVIRKLGDFGEYRYGSPRKRALIGWEQAKADARVLAA